MSAAVRQTPVAEGELLWTPLPEFVAGCHMKAFLAWLERSRGLVFEDYPALWHWSVADLEGFWSAIWEYFDIWSTTPYERVLDPRPMPQARWFVGARVNYAEHLLRFEQVQPEAIALRHGTEEQPLADLTWRQMGRAVRVLATRLRALGVRPGDTVGAVLPNVPQAVIAMMATTAIGAVWAAAAPEFGVHAVVDRFTQIRPRLLFAADGYRFGGRSFDRRSEVEAIVGALPSVEALIWLDCLGSGGPRPERARAIAWQAAMEGPESDADSFEFTRVAWDHPLWVVFSSGTTGLPKAIVHGHVGMLVEHLKLVSLHLNLGPGKTLFFPSTTGWMMWNVVVSGLLAGATIVLYDGSPVHPDTGTLWRIVQDSGATHAGVSPALLQLMEKAQLRPREFFDLGSLEMITLSGSPCPPETYAWIYHMVKSDVWVASQSGGTEICSAFVGAVPMIPVRAGEMQARMLGMDVDAWDDEQRSVVDEIGELVVKRPCPSMPIRFWNDAKERRYRESHFARFPGAWHHGDFLKINGRGGCFIYGRSDSTLNRQGVRIGTSEIYRVVERVQGVADSIVVCCQFADGSSWMPLFVQMKPSCEIDDALRSEIRAKLREEGSPRHVPDAIEAVVAIPYTLTGKKMEVPVRRILMGTPIEQAASLDAMPDPKALTAFEEIARRHGK